MVKNIPLGPSEVQPHDSWIRQNVRSFKSCGKKKKWIARIFLWFLDSCLDSRTLRESRNLLWSSTIHTAACQWIFLSMAKVSNFYFNDIKSRITWSVHYFMEEHLCPFQLCGIDQLWNIAVQVRSSEVSWAAITYLNSLYINGKHTFIFL